MENVRKKETTNSRERDENKPSHLHTCLGKY